MTECQGFPGGTGLLDGTKSQRILDNCVQGHISLTECGVQKFFGMMGTHIYMSPFNDSSILGKEDDACKDDPGAYKERQYCILWLQDRFYSDHLGRKVVVLSPSRTAAAYSLLSFLHELTGDSLSLETPVWMYRDPRTKALHGPYSSATMARWYAKKYFDDHMPVLYSEAVENVWVPVWMVERFAGFLRDDADFVGLQDDPHQVDDMDWERTIQQDISLLRQDQTNVESVDVRLSHTSIPMDYDAIVPIADVLEDGSSKNVYVVATLDTNVLLSHFSFLERAFQEIQSGGLHVKVSLLVVIPWIVLNELDHLKEGRQRQAALYAIKRIHTLYSQRDSYVYIQGAGCHQDAVDKISLPDQKQSLRNDDFIMQTCIYFRNMLVKKLREKGHRAHAVLVSNDRGLQIRSTANGITCIKAVDFGRNSDALINTLISLEHSTGGGDVVAVQDAFKSPRSGSDHIDGGEEHKDITKEVETFLNSLQLTTEPSMKKRDIHPLNRHSDPTYYHGKQEVASRAFHGEGMKSVLEFVILHGLGCFVMYCRQQDLGDLWEDLLEDELKPPWESKQVLKVILRHSSTFWSVFDRKLLSDIKTLLRYMNSSQFDTHSSECVDIVFKLIRAAEQAFTKPINEVDEPPDPSSVPHFVSLGDAKAAISESKHKLAALLA